MPMNPHLQEALIHGLIGAGAWGGLGALSGALEADPGERGRGALIGGATGAALGGITHGAFGGLGSVARQEAQAARAARESARQSYRASNPFTGGPHRGSANTGGFNRDPGFWEDYARNRGRGWAKAENMGEQGVETVAPWLKGVTSKADAKRMFREQARAAHPDVGGSDAAMKNLNLEWDRAQAHPAFQKLSHAHARGCAAALARYGVTR